jgi:hypothetical protein
MENKLCLIYDIFSCPENINLENIYNIMNNSGIVVWDSSKNGKEPIIIDSNELSLMDVKFMSIQDIESKFSNIS